MDTISFDTCPRCGAGMQAGFSGRAAGLSFVDPEKFEHFVFIDEDISQAGLKKLLPSNAEYYQSFLCRDCKLYIIDYSESYSRKEAEQMANSLQR